MKSHLLFRLTIIIIMSMVLAACGATATPAAPAPVAVEPATAVPTRAAPPTSSRPANPELILATTTSTQDSGLLDVLIPMFEKDTGYKVKVVAVGSGEALQMGQQGNADVLLVHSPSAETNFMNFQYGKERLLVMHNDFVVVGPSSDPARVKGSASAMDAFKKIAGTGAPFVSRGDNSGTNTKELSLWKSAGIDPATTRPSWYIQSGQGMGATLTIASEKEAYTLTDRATYLAEKANLKLDILIEKDKLLLNVYHVITVNPGKWPKVNYQGAKAFATWITSSDVQVEIGKFGVEKYGQQLFVPDAGKNEQNLGS